MKKLIVAIALVWAVGAIAVHSSAESKRQASVETISPLSMMMEVRSLPSESFDTF
jgi:hypothetical protein